MVATDVPTDRVRSICERRAATPFRSIDRIHFQSVNQAAAVSHNEFRPFNYIAGKRYLLACTRVHQLTLLAYVRCFSAARTHGRHTAVNIMYQDTMPNIPITCKTIRYRQRVGAQKQP